MGDLLCHCGTPLVVLDCCDLAVCLDCTPRRIGQAPDDSTVHAHIDGCASGTESACPACGGIDKHLRGCVYEPVTS